MNKCFLLNPEKNLVANTSCRFRENALLILKNDVTEPKARKLATLITSLKAINKLKNSFRLPETMVFGSLKLIFNLITD